MSTVICESGVKVPSGSIVRVPVTPSVVSTASVLIVFTARCSSTFTVTWLFGCAVNRSAPDGSGVEVADATAADGLGFTVATAAGAAEHATRQTDSTARMRRTNTRTRLDVTRFKDRAAGLRPPPYTPEGRLRLGREFPCGRSAELLREHDRLR